MCLKKKPTHFHTEHLFIDCFTARLLTSQFRLPREEEEEEEQRKNDTESLGGEFLILFGHGS